MEHEERLDRHGREIAAHGVRLDGHDSDISHLWKTKVSTDRYIWVERIIMGLCGAILLWVLQGVLGE